MARVLVTRPDPGATRTARRLETLGFEPVILPLSETRPLPVARDSVPLKAKAVAVTSANALRHAPSGLVERLSGLPCHAVGARTAESARRAGFFSVSEGPGDAAGLAEMIATELGETTLAYLCGRVRMPEFEKRLFAYGIKVVPIETYDTVALAPPRSAVSQALSGQPIDAVLVYSARAAAALGVLMEVHAEADLLLRNARCCCMSARIAAAFGGGLNVEVALDPNEDALLALLGDPD
ncbi:uroporphyrinogen-III synthase [Aminobacter sp. HY435]|uniref:uroporphyrinogen-III synthase n=1 Tax=Aminobacter sp. HY435 TaxID=2970917 RepID=UPI0022B98439|nr:uroporphyrinogen-III synthase [Aminobacter sp. HY435]